MKWILLSLSLCLTSITFSQSEFQSESELIQYISGVWNIDSLYSGWTGFHLVPTQFFADSSFVYLEFAESDVPETPLLFRYYFDGVLQEETSVSISFQQESSFVGYWHIEVNSQFFPIPFVVAENDFEPAPKDDLITLAEYAFDANTYYLSKCFPEYDVHSAPIFTQYLDFDGDGFGTDESFVIACDKLDGYSYEDGDCDDNDASINPNAEEIPGNEIDENCDRLLGTSSTKDKITTHLEVYPNPTFDYLFLKSDKNENFIVSLYSMQGNLICTYDSPDRISLTDLPSSCYILKSVFKNDTSPSIHKIIKN